mgnify:CR=1 FL=1
MVGLGEINANLYRLHPGHGTATQILMLSYELVSFNKTPTSSK